MTEPERREVDEHCRSGDRLARAGRLDEAAACYWAALALAPDDAGIRAGLGNVLLGLGEADQALAAYRAALAGGFDHPLLHYNMGTALRALGRPGEARLAFQEALARNPGFAPAHNNLGNALRDLGRLGEAAAAYLEALALRPGDGGTRVNLAGALRLLHEEDAAAAAALARRWLAQAVADPMARHVAAALAGGPAPERAEDGYVRQLFDGFAADFERRLAELDYRVPGLMAAALDSEPAGSLAVLDAGCGTGLCAPLLRPYARTLAGVDLSPEMLERARARGLYDSLEAAELTAFLAAHPGAFDLIVAADVLCYFGALEAVLAAAAAALRPGGRLLFTVERDPAADAPPFTLQASGRYRHAPDAVAEALAAARLGIIESRPEGLRHENGRDVPGLLVVTEIR